MGIDTNDIHFFLHQVVSLVANSCLTFVRQYPLVFFSSLCLLLFNLFLPHVFLFVFHSFPILVTVVISVVLLQNGGRTKKNTPTTDKPVVIQAEKTLNHENENSVNPRNPKDNDYTNMFNKSTPDEITKEIREVIKRAGAETLSSSNIYETPAVPVRRHDDAGVSKQRVHSDKKDLKNILLAEMERNRRIESLTAKRRARKLLSMQVRNTLLNMGKNNSPTSLNIGSIQIPKTNPLLSHNPSLVVSPTPGSAPSVLLPAHNPFRVPYDVDQPNKSENPVFRRGDSFSHGSFTTDFDQLNTHFHEQISPCMPLMNEAGQTLNAKKGPNSIEKRDIEMGRGNIEIAWVASSHLNNIEEDESRSREVHEVSNQDIIDVGFSSILNPKNDDIIKSDKEEDGDHLQHAMYDVSEDEDNMRMKLSESKKSQTDQLDSSDEEISEDMFMESLRKLTTPKASHNTTILKERLINRVSKDDNYNIQDHSPKEHVKNASTSPFLGPVPSPKSVLQQNLSTLSTSSLDPELINVEVRQPEDKREFEENSNGILGSSISIKIEQESSIPNQDNIPTDETNGPGSNINGHTSQKSDTIVHTMKEPYVLVEHSDVSETPKDVETAKPTNHIEDAKEILSEKNTQMIVSEEDHSHSPDQLRIEIT